MFADLDQRISETRQDLRRREKLRDQIECARADLAAAMKRKKALAVRLEEEGEDVAKLERLTFTSLIADLLGEREARLDGERRELAEARLRYEEHLTAVGSLSVEIRELERQQEGLPSDLDERYRALLVEKEQLLRAADGPNARELDELADRIADAASQSREVSEAVAAGHGALDALQVVDRALQSASSWGTFDLLGGGLFATMVKQGKLRDARSAAANAGSYLRGFGRELRDVQLRHSDLTVDLSEFATLADYFFDGLIIDWFVQKRIREAVDRVTAMTDEVEGLLEVLGERGRQNAANLERLEQRRLELLE